jgi:hypothetical protein
MLGLAPNGRYSDRRADSRRGYAVPACCIRGEGEAGADFLARQFGEVAEHLIDDNATAKYSSTS